MLNRRALLKLLGFAAGAAALNRRTAAAATDRSPSSPPPLSERAGVGAAPAGADRSMGVADRIAEFIVAARFEDLPAAVVAKAKEQIVYHFGVAFSGSFTDEARTMREVVRHLGQPSGGATVIGERLRLFPSDAAFANCTLMRATWRDDVLWPAGIHAGLMTLPTALAIGESRHVSGAELLLAFVLGYEVLGKLGRAADSWATALPRRPTMIYGPFGSLTTAGRLLKLDRQRMANALGYAANLGMGVPEGGQTDHFYGLISRNATFAAQLAEVGGAPYSTSTIEGSTGLFRSFFGEVPATLPELVARLGSDWEILGAAQKRFPGTSQNTVAIELFLSVVNERRLTAGQLTKLDVFVSWPEDSDERKKELTFRGPFRNWMDAYSSLPYALALALVDGKINPERFRDGGNLNDPVVAAIMQRINITFEAGHGPERYCRLELTSADGGRFVRDSDNSDISASFTYAFPQSVWSDWLQLDGKRLLSLEQLERLEQFVIDLENLDDVSKLMASLVPAEARRDARPIRVQP